MKNLTKMIYAAGFAAIVFSPTSCYSTKKWVENRIEQRIEDRLDQYGQKDRKWTKEKILAELRLYEQISEQRFETKMPLEQLINAFNGTYQVLNNSFYKTREGILIDGPSGSGSGILLKGGYLLTAAHVVSERFNYSLSHNYWGLVNYDHHKLVITADKRNKYELEKVLVNRSLDYAILKLKDAVDLPHYSPGFNLPKKVEPGMRSAAIGFPLSSGRNIRLGNVSQIKSDAGISFLTFKNSIIFGDSGGPIFVVEDGALKFAAFSDMLRIMRDYNDRNIRHPTNIGYGVKISSVVKDVGIQLLSGKLDEKTSKKIEDFLMLNLKKVDK